MNYTPDSFKTVGGFVVYAPFAKLLDTIATDTPLQSEDVAGLLYSTMLPKLDQIMLAIEGIVTPLQRKLLFQILSHIADMTKRIGDMDDLLKEYMAE